MEHRRARIEAQVRIGPQLAIVPAASRIPARTGHVFAENPAEPGLRQKRRTPSGIHAAAGGVQPEARLRRAGAQSIPNSNACPPREEAEPGEARPRERKEGVCFFGYGCSRIEGAGTATITGIASTTTARDPVSTMRSGLRDLVGRSLRGGAGVATTGSSICRSLCSRSLSKSFICTRNASHKRTTQNVETGSGGALRTVPERRRKEPTPPAGWAEPPSHEGARESPPG